ncbi:GTPase ObgE [Candidatus Beckwithbacteria bacterium CG10_big_fil_rev_8_21_14_0_10_34_10]|uniref:GTPase ObgE n=1 Tax=Candidatus Beckwithbacteria bacterium CG10_big_fil_rev_8_21_14_0_10_34_10 TaxID=1974495 RepID=A0A2H0W8K0_9BACT|nr:MAG: GTPase ObgE [Candidatus Beckwithbacteria bacterium CG10_big_fil_rev_8_21_14_0_10_34_10]
MLITEINIKFKAGDGGSGKVSFYKSRRGPDGGNGGNGGSIFITPTSDIYALANLSQKVKIEAENGQSGMDNKKNGRFAKDLEVKLPLGTIITDKNTKEVFEVTPKNDCFLLCQGGKGGLGNFEYRSSINVTPMNAQKGFPGEKRDLYINLKLIADFGLVGFPNAGKSSLLKEITNANPKIGCYPFTTLEPNLGELGGKIIADIPGLIKGASKGKGLGIKFLKHIEKVSLLFHCLSCEIENPEKNYQQIRNELKKYNPELLKIPEIILLTKTDLKTKPEIKNILKNLKKINKKILPVSIHNWESLKKLKTLILKSSQ